MNKAHDHAAHLKKSVRKTSHGFTLIETMLAMVLGAMVLTGVFGVLLSLNKMESTFAARFERTNEMSSTHTIITRAMLSLQMKQADTSRVTRGTNQPEPQETDEPESRDRMILETDPSTAPDITGWVPQRFELVSATPPVPAGLASQAAGWYVARDQVGTSDFSASAGLQGVVRGVFELRPTGQRERIMQNLGLLTPGEKILDTVEKAGITLDQAHPSPNWTLWWRPILRHEGAQLEQAIGPLGDTIGSPEQIRERLAGAVPLLRNIERCIWEVYKGDEYISSYSGLTMSDLPAYAQFEVILTNGQYASWMFEIDWVLGDEPNISGGGSDGSAEDTDDANGDNNNNGNNNGSNGQRPGRPGGNVDPQDAHKFNFSNDS